MAADEGNRGQRITEAVSTLNPGYFALVMASGIISVGLILEGFDVPSGVLFTLCAASYAMILALNLVRFVRHRAAMVRDATDPSRAFGFYTFVAGTNVLGVRTAAAGVHWLAALLLAIGAVAWIVLGYVIPWTAVLGRAERPVVKEANGTWFVWSVASQSVAVGCATLEPFAGPATMAVALLGVLAWSVGIVLYAATGIFVALRLMVYPVEAEDLRPGYFVAMGAMAITVLAGARLIEMSDAPIIDATRGLIAGASVAFWAFATWLFPALVAVGAWRHLVKRVSLSYEPGLWSVIFPLGMYAVAAIYLGRADRLPIVEAIGEVELWVAVVAFVATFVAMALHLARVIQGGRVYVPRR